MGSIILRLKHRGDLYFRGPWADLFHGRTPETGKSHPEKAPKKKSSDITAWTRYGTKDLNKLKEIRQRLFAASCLATRFPRCRGKHWPADIAALRKGLTEFMISRPSRCQQP